MRVASNSYSDSLINHLQTLTRRQTALQTQIATGQRFKSAAEDPLAAQQVLDLRDESVATSQYQKNIQIHQEFATANHSALKSLHKIVNRAQEIAVSADQIESPDALKAYGLEVGELIKQAIHISNRQYRGEFIFSGTKSGNTTYTPTLDATGRVQSVEFGGNESQANSEIAPGVLIASRVSAENRSGSGELGLFADARTGSDLFGHLITLQNQLLSGDAKSIQEQTRVELAKDEENFLYHVASNGALQSRLETMLSLNKDHALALEGNLSKRTDIDFPEAIVRLTQQQTAYQATLQSAGSVLNMSLLNYLR